MKRSDCFKMAALIACLLAAGCVKHDEMEFKGKVIDIRQCNLSYLDQTPGYVVQLEYPEGVGGSITEDGNTADNLVVLYEPDHHVMKDDVIHGRFYLDEKYSKVNCSVRWDYDLPEGVFTKVVVED